MCQLLLHFTKAWENQNMSCSKMINDLTLISFDSHSLLFSVPKFHPHTEKKPSDSLEGKSTRIICNWYLYKTNILTQGTEIPLSMFIFITSCGVHNKWTCVTTYISKPFYLIIQQPARLQYPQTCISGPWHVLGLYLPSSRDHPPGVLPVLRPWNPRRL